MIHSIKRFVNKKKYMLERISQDAMYMCSGEYNFDNTLRYIYMNDGISNKKAHHMFGKNFIKPSYKIGLFLIKIFFFRKSIVISNGKKVFDGFQGTVCYIGIVNNSGKIFDFTNNKVLTFFANQDKYLSTTNNYEYFKSIFPIPQILYCNDKQLLIIEEFFEFKPCNKWSVEDYKYVMDDVFERYYQYFIKAMSCNSFCNTNLISFIEDVEDEVANYILCNTEPKLLTIEFPFLKLHGDLWAPNILINYRERYSIHYIDFEYASDYIFFYDFFWLITEQAILNDNFILIEKYFSGDYDNCLSRMFNAFNIQFLIKNRLDYLNMFFLNLSVKRWSTFKRKNRIKCFNEYKNLIKRINDYYNKME